MGGKGPDTVTYTKPATKTESDDPPPQVAFDAVDPTFRPTDSERYLRQRVLGVGGMGTVMLVRDRTIGRQVALKELNDGGRSEQARQRFAREARLQGQLEHPAIVPVYDVGSVEDGKPFFTMKRVRGQLLADVLAERRRGTGTTFSRRKLLSAFSQLCAAAEYAHERGVVHRDIKPTNVMLGAYGEVYLLDWGVAKVAAEQDPAPEVRPSEPAIDATAGVHTGEGSIMGTLTTMAPEQAVGGEVGARTDVYALGAVLFEILTGEPLHPRGDFEDVVRAITSGVDARPSLRVPDAAVPPELEELLVRATKLDPEERLPSAMALRDAIEAYLDGDRDLELRREGARKHTDTAEVAAAAALSAEPGSGTEEVDRTTALREVGRALALDPENHRALQVLVDLLTSPPKTMPREILAEQDASTRKNIRRGGIAGVLVYGYITLNSLWTSALGVRDFHAFVTAHLLWLAALVASAVTIVRPSYPAILTAFAFGILDSTYLTTVFGPYLLVSWLITMHAVLFAFVRDWGPRIGVIVASCAAWTVSVFGQSWGLFPETVSFVDGDLVIHSTVVRFPATVTTVYLYTAVLATIIAPALVVGALRSAYYRSEIAMRLQGWQLRRLVSDGRR